MQLHWPNFTVFWRRLFLSVIAILFLISVYCLIQIFIFLSTPIIPPGKSIIYYFAPHKNITQLAYDLKREANLEHPKYLIWLARLEGKLGRLKAGEYEFTGGLTPRGLLKILESGKVVERRFTIVEGWNFPIIWQHLTHNSYLNSENLSPQLISGLLQKWGSKNLHPEGLFFPATYRFERGQSPVIILIRAYQFMQQQLEITWNSRAVGLPYQDPYQALIVASIIEKETAQNYERPIVADIILKRWQHKMLLQMDPTVIYGLGPQFVGPLKRSDLKSNSPYNTYVNKGLPPTPIAMPSLSSIQAALHPAATPYWYFVAKGDGTHIFSRTLEQQQHAIARVRTKASSFK